MPQGSALKLQVCVWEGTFLFAKDIDLLVDIPCHDCTFICVWASLAKQLRVSWLRDTKAPAPPRPELLAEDVGALDRPHGV